MKIYNSVDFFFFRSAQLYKSGAKNSLQALCQKENDIEFRSILCHLFKSQQKTMTFCRIFSSTDINMSAWGVYSLMILTSVLLFFCRFSSESFKTTACVSPYPLAMILDGDIPLEIRYFLTESALP